MNKLYLRLPASHIGNWSEHILAYLLCAKDGTVLREGRATLAELAKDISKTKIVLLVAATDVTLLEITIPVMPEAKLKSALAVLVEDQLIGDPSDCVFQLVPKQTNGEVTNKRTVAVVQRGWLQQLSSSLYSLGASYVKALPEQLCLPYESDRCSVFLEQFPQSPGLYCALRSGLNSGVGILLESEQSVEQYLSTISLLAPPGPLVLQLSHDSMEDELKAQFKSVIEGNPAWADRITIEASNWVNTIDEVKSVGINLMAGLNSSQTSRIKWKRWRWPLLLGASVLIVNIVGLNAEYWSLKREAQALKMGITQTYKVNFPKDALVPFPLEQMKKNLEIAKRNSGKAASYDFTVLLTGFGSAWSSISAAQLPKIASIEYKDYSLIVQVKGDVPQEELKKELLGKGLTLKKINAEVWQIKEVE